jgi:hypothetical protein
MEEPSTLESSKLCPSVPLVEPECVDVGTRNHMPISAYQKLLVSQTRRVRQLRKLIEILGRIMNDGER